MNVITPAPRSEWERIYEADPLAAPYLHPNLLHALVGGRNRDASRLYRFSDGQQVVVPILATGLGALSMFVGLPHHWGWGGVVCSQPFTKDHASAILKDLAAMPSVSTTFRTDSLRGDIWCEADLPPSVIDDGATSFLVDLNDGYEAAFSRFSRSSRKSIRKADSQGLRFESGHSDDHFRAYFDLMDNAIVHWAKNQNEPAALYRYRQRDALNQDLTRKVLDSMGSRIELILALLDDQVVAVGLNLSDKHGYGLRMLLDHEAPRSVAVRDAFANECIKRSADSGANFYDLASSDPASPQSIYKAKLAKITKTHNSFVMSPAKLHIANRYWRKAVKSAIGFRDFKPAQQPDPTD